MLLYFYSLFVLMDYSVLFVKMLKRKLRGLSDSTAGRAFASHTANPGSSPGIPYGPEPARNDLKINKQTNKNQKAKKEKKIKCSASA